MCGVRQMPGRPAPSPTVSSRGDLGTAEALPAALSSSGDTDQVPSSIAEGSVER